MRSSGEERRAGAGTVLATRTRQRQGSASDRGPALQRKEKHLLQRLKSKEGIARFTLLGVVLAFFGNVLFAGVARADYGPSSYDPNTGKGDVVCVGSDTLQFLGNFLADGSAFGKAGYNSNGAKHDKLVSLDATG